MARYRIRRRNGIGGGVVCSDSVLDCMTRKPWADKGSRLPLRIGVDLGWAKDLIYFADAFSYCYGSQASGAAIKVDVR